MKKIILFLLIAIISFGNIFCFVGCGKESEVINESKEKIYLTTDNASTYLNIEANTYGSDYSGYCYKSITSNVSISGASSNFNYYNVKITIKITGSMVLGSASNAGTTYYQTLYCSLNIGGVGSASTKDYVYTLSGKMTSTGANAYSVKGRSYEIVSVSGYVERI